MKVLITMLALLFTMNFYGQTLIQKLETVKTTKQANNFISKNTELQGSVLQIDSNVDTSELQKQFYLKKTGDIFSIGTNTYKVIAEKTAILSRVSYIFLDGTQLSSKQIDAVRKFILDEYKKGVLFDSLAAKYNMDGNQNFGDTNWFADGVMAEEFSDAVKQHNLSDVFTVDVPASKWYFIVKKTYESKQSKKMTMLQVKSGG